MINASQAKEEALYPYWIRMKQLNSATCLGSISYDGWLATVMYNTCGAKLQFDYKKVIFLSTEITVALLGKYVQQQ